MRYATCAMLGMFFVAWCSTSAWAEESGSWWWPFGGKEQAAEPVETPPAATEEQKPWMFSSPLAKVSWPEFKLPHYELHTPELSMPRVWPSKEETEEVRNAWAESNAEAAKASPWQVVTDSTQQLTTSTRNAWNKTVDVLNPFDESSASVTRRGTRTASRKRWFRKADDDQSQGPRTVTEWMAQQRLDP